MTWDPTKERRVVLCDVYDVSTDEHQGDALELFIPYPEEPKSWKGRGPTGSQLLDFLAAEPEIRSDDRFLEIVERDRAGRNPNQRALDVVKDLRAEAALASWVEKRKVNDATKAEA